MRKLFIFLIAVALLCPGSWAYAQAAHPPVNGTVTIAAVTSTSRTALPNLASASCTLQAPTGNTGTVYVGGSTVTNASGANVGTALIQGASIGNVSVTNSAAIYVAADSANDKVTWLCN